MDSIRRTFNNPTNGSLKWPHGDMYPKSDMNTTVCHQFLQPALTLLVTNWDENVIVIPKILCGRIAVRYSPFHAESVYMYFRNGPGHLVFHPIYIHHTQEFVKQ